MWNKGSSEGFLSNITKPSWEAESPFRNPLLIVALALVALFHGALLLTGSFAETYDAYIHMFMGDHYARDWFSTWDQRWYTGFTTVSYPPGTHMAIAALSFVVGDLRIAFALVMLLGLLLLTVGIYRFSRLWVSEKAAGAAAILLATASGVAETVHLFGQLPTIFSLAFLLNASWYVARFLYRGSPSSLLLAAVTLAGCTAGHHVTTLFGAVFFLGPVVAFALLEASKPEEQREGTFSRLIIHRLARALPYSLRVGVLGATILTVLIGVVLPYWIWSATDPIAQIPIPHGTREDFIARPNLGLIFFVIPWGLSILLLPFAARRYIRSRQWPIAASLLLAFVLGTGGTTPIPKLILRGAFDILTLDRFTFWATILLLPAAGQLVVELVSKAGTLPAFNPKRVAIVGFACAHLGIALFTSTLTSYRAFQPDPIDMQPIVEFLEKDQHERWRYITLGFGDQMAWLSTQTEATQVDGNYHSARRLPELVSSPIERLEGAKYTGIEGLGSLQQLLTVPEKYHLKFIFSNDEFYDPILNILGWKNLGPLENGIYLWERADIEPLPVPLPINEIPNWQRALWGVLPPTAILLSLAIFILGFGRTQVEGSSRLAREGLEQRRLKLLAWSERELAITVKESPTRKGLKFPRGMMKLAAGFAAAVLVTTVGIKIVSSNSLTPEETVESYYAHLNFREFEAAYDFLNPSTRPDYELWRLQLARTGGLIASYSTLDSVEIELETLDEDSVVANTSRLYLTSINYITEVDDLRLDRVNGDWLINPAKVDVSNAPDQLVRNSEVSFFQQGRRQVTSQTTDLADIQDRPRLEVSELQLLTFADQPRITGIVRNIDVDPADITLTGVLRDSGSSEVANYNSDQKMKRTLMPGETTSFVIEFAAVGALNDLEFDPFEFEPMTLAGDEDYVVELYAKAVVTDDRLDRSLSLRNFTLSDGKLTGEFYNGGTNTSLVPRLIVTYLNQGRVVEVENFFVDQAVLPQRSGAIEIELAETIPTLSSDLDVQLSINGEAKAESIIADNSALVIEADGLGYDQIRLDASSYWSEQ